MIRAIFIFAALVAVFILDYRTLGYTSAYQVGHGAATIMGLAISLTFLWLWWVRATPLALGMAFSWAGAACVLGWWWFFDLLEQPEFMAQSPGLFVFLSLYVAGAILHFRVIEETLAWPRQAFWVPILGALGLSTLIWAMG